jgi:hypothetical protein
VALIWVGLLFAVGAAGARTVDGISNASDSLYVAFDLLILLGTFLVAIDRTPADDAAVTRRNPSALGLRVVVGVLVIVQVMVGTVNGLTHGRDYRGSEVATAVVTSKIREAPDGLVASQLGAGYESAAFIRQMTAYARSEHLSLFSTAYLEWYERQQIPKSTTTPVVFVGKPGPGDVVHGSTFLDAGASDPLGVTRVWFFARGGGGASFLIGSANYSVVGWLARWDTERLPNGTYWIRAVASSPGGLRSNSPWVQVQLSNRTEATW